MQHSDRAKRDVTRGQKRDVTIGGDAVQLVARTRGDARTRKISCQCVIFPFKQYAISLFKAVVTIGGDAIQLVARTRRDARTRKVSCKCVIFPFKQYVIFLLEAVCYIAFNSYVIRSNSPVICSSDRYATRATSVVY